MIIYDYTLINSHKPLVHLIYHLISTYNNISHNMRSCIPSFIHHTQTYTPINSHIPLIHKSYIDLSNHIPIKYHHIPISTPIYPSYNHISIYTIIQDLVFPLTSIIYQFLPAQTPMYSSHISTILTYQTIWQSYITIYPHQLPYTPLTPYIPIIHQHIITKYPNIRSHLPSYIHHISAHTSINFHTPLIHMSYTHHILSSYTPINS